MIFLTANMNSICVVTEVPAQYPIRSITCYLLPPKGPHKLQWTLNTELTHITMLAGIFRAHNFHTTRVITSSYFFVCSPVDSEPPANQRAALSGTSRFTCAPRKVARAPLNPLCAAHAEHISHQNVASMCCCVLCTHEAVTSAPHVAQKRRQHAVPLNNVLRKNLAQRVERITKRTAQTSSGEAKNHQQQYNTKNRPTTCRASGCLRGSRVYI